MPAQTFESLRVWHDARRLTAHIYKISSNGLLNRDFGLRDQIRRASISTMSNIAEGYERGRRKEFLHFLVIAKASAAEVRSQLYAAEDVGYLTPQIAAELRREATLLARRITALMKKIGEGSGDK
jgi:four helix bundle protein